ncbi:uncharacterized protein PG998_013071 [Apiospora kogelbergensis]|uniref:uncharacterized protein n=1 Tax=Apiospora kogelbergensis TaxID=1337665 RepID=UPI003130FD3E
MGHRSKFTFPVPGRKPKPSPPATAAGPALTKAERILGTGGINVDSPTQSSVRSPPQPWDAKSGISISISESSDGYATVQTGLGIRPDDNDDYEGSATAGTSYAHAPCPWDLESDIIPRQLRSAQGQDYVNPLRPKRSAATIGHDYRDATTTASTMMRRQSNASTIFTHYDPHQVPLSISQQTSSSAMAKGLPSKVSNLLDVDALLGKSDKRKPAKLDLSRLRPGNRSNKDASPLIDPVLGNNYVMRSPSFVSQTSPIKEGFPMPPNAYGSKRTSRKITKFQPGSNNQSTDTLPSTISKMSDLNQLYDHYERQLFGQEDEEPEESSSPLLEFPMPPTTDHRFSSEPSPPLTTASTHMSSLFVTPLSNPVVRSHQQQLPYRNRQDSNASLKATTTAILPSQGHLQHSQEDASSISSRNTRTSKVSQQKSPLDTNLQQRSVLSLSDSESEDETFSDSAPMSSMSSHGQASHGGSPASDYRKRPLPQQPTAPRDHTAQAESKSNTYGQLSEFLTVPTSTAGLVPRSSPAVSQTTLRSASSSSTTTGVSKSGSGPAADRGSGLSARSSSTVESLSRAKPARQPHDVYGVHEAKVIAILPVASTADAAMGGPESDYREFDHRISRQGNLSQRNSDQPTPPLSPTSVDFYMQSPKSIDRSSVSESAATEAHNARFMAVTRQEEMLLAALRKKRAIMRENILAEIEGEKGSVASLDTSGSSTSGSRSSRQFDNKGPAAATSARHGRKASSSGSDSMLMPVSKRNTPSPQVVFPGRSSSLARDMKDLTADGGSYRSGSSLSQRRVGPASRSAMRAASSSRLPSATARAGARDSADSDLRLSGYGGPIRVLMFLDRPLGGLEAIDSAEPSPDLSEFLDFDMERQHGDDDQRRSRARSRYNTSGGHGGYYSSSGGSNSRRASNRPRADSNALNPMTSPLRIQLDGVPEQEYADDDLDADDDDLYDDDHFDGFSDVIEHERLTTMGSNYSRSQQQPQQQLSLRPDSPVHQHQMLGHIKGKNSAVRISAVGPSWGDDD